MSLAGVLGVSRRVVGNQDVATVFGGTGFMGRYVVNRFGRAGSRVVVPYRGEEKDCDHLKPMGILGQVVQVPFSIRDKESVQRAVSKSNIVVNLLGKHYPTRNFTLHEANVESARTIATAAKNAGVSRFIHMSLVGADINSSSEWKRTKAESEMVVKEIFPEATILRCTTVFGLQDRFLNKYGKLAQMLRLIPLPFDPQTKIQPVFVRDVASAVMSALQNEITKGKTYELAGQDVYTIDEIIHDIIFPITRRDPRVFYAEGFLAKLITKILERPRTPLFLSDELKFFEEDNILTSKDALTLADLDIAPTPLDEMAIKILRQYKPGIYEIQ